MSRIRGSRFAADNPWLEGRRLEERLVLLKMARSGVEREPKNYATPTEHNITIRRKYCQTQLIFATGGFQSCQQVHVSASILVIFMLYSFLF